MIKNFRESIIKTLKTIVGPHDVFFFQLFLMMNIPRVDKRRWGHPIFRKIFPKISILSKLFWLQFTLTEWQTYGMAYFSISLTEIHGDLDPMECMLVHLLSLGGQENRKNRYEGICFFIKNHNNEALIERLGNDTESSINKDFRIPTK